MICARAEDHLSAYIDNALDPELHQQVREHLAACAHCKDVLEDYRRFDAMIASTPRIEPDASLRERLFASPEVIALAERQANPPAAMLTRLMPRVRGAAVRRQPAMASGPPRRATPPAWASALLPLAAVLTMVLGTTLLVRQGLLSFGGTSSRGYTTTIGAPDPAAAPFPAGPRLLFTEQGVLWSIAQSGGQARRLSAPGTCLLGSYAVSPLTSAADGRMVAYVDAITGTVHVVRSDGQSDTIVGRVEMGMGAASGTTCASTASATPLALVWSPDGTRLAYLAPQGTSGTSLHVVNADGSQNVLLTVADGARTGTPVWSADGSTLAFVRQNGGVTSVWLADLLTGTARQVAAQLDPEHADALLAGSLAWVPDATAPRLTWAVRDARGISGIFSIATRGEAAPLRVTPNDGTRYTAAAYAPARNGGVWMVADGAQVATVSARTPGLVGRGQAAAPVRSIAWAPSGQVAALSEDGHLELWSDAQGFVPVAQGAVSAAPAWSADGQRLAYVSDGTVFAASVSHGALVGASTPLARDLSAQALRWARDGLALAVATDRDVRLLRTDGTQNLRVTSHVGAASEIGWSEAR